MRKLIKNKNISDYQAVLSIIRPSVGSSKTLMTNNTNTISDYNALRSHTEFKNIVMDVKNDYCPYCEINAIDNLGSRFEVDHIKPKHPYNCLAIAWDNLAPSCHSCNHKKGNSEEVLNPITSDFSKIKFEFHPTPDNFNNILVVSKDSSTIKSLDILQLQLFYNSRIESIRNQISLIHDAAQGGNDIMKYIGFNNKYGRLLECYYNEFGF